MPDKVAEGSDVLLNSQRRTQDPLYGAAATSSHHGIHAVRRRRQGQCMTWVVTGMHRAKPTVQGCQYFAARNVEHPATQSTPTNCTIEWWHPPCLWPQTTGTRVSRKGRARGISTTAQSIEARYEHHSLHILEHLTGIVFADVAQIQETPRFLGTKKDRLAPKKGQHYIIHYFNVFSKTTMCGFYQKRNSSHKWRTLRL